MKRMMNITDYMEDLQRYQGAEELSQVLESFGLDGLEVMPSHQKPLYPFGEGQVLGVHMRCQSDWLDLWTGNAAALDQEYGGGVKGRKTWQAVYGSNPRKWLLDRARQDLEYAGRCRAEYVVFHVSHIRAGDIWKESFEYTDFDVTTAAAAFIGELFQDWEGERPWFLVENLWWPGMRMTDPQLTGMFLEQIPYEKKGIMLDVGHFLHTNPGLRTQAEGVAGIHKMLAAHWEVREYIRGIHLHQTLNGAYVERMRREAPPFPAEYGARFGMAMEQVFAIDQHLPFTDSGVKGLVEEISPDYLTLEFISADRTEHEEKLKKQLAVL